MALIRTDDLPLRTEQDIVIARQTVRRLTQEIRFSLVDQTKVVTAASELARNTLVYGGGGRAEIYPVHNGRAAGISARVSDDGPGIADLGLAMTDGYTSGGGLGLGLSGSRRLVDEFDIDTAPGAGTR